MSLGGTENTEAIHRQCGYLKRRVTESLGRTPDLVQALILQPKPSPYKPTRPSSVYPVRVLRPRVTHCGPQNPCPNPLQPQAPKIDS